MVKAAEDQWPTLDKDFGRLLDDWRQLGLIGKAISKAPRRGGEGLWHPNQLVIWMNLIAFRFDQGLRVPTLPNWPVGLWRLGTDGIELEQVQRASSFGSGTSQGVLIQTSRHAGAEDPVVMVDRGVKIAQLAIDRCAAKRSRPESSTYPLPVPRLHKRGVSGRF